MKNWEEEKKDEQKEGTPVIWYPSDTAAENKREKRIVTHTKTLPETLARCNSEGTVIFTVVLRIIEGEIQSF